MGLNPGSDGGDGDRPCRRTSFGYAGLHLMRPLTITIIKWAAALAVVWLIALVLIAAAQADEFKRHDWIIEQYPHCCSQKAHCRQVILRPLGWGYTFEHPWVPGKIVIVPLDAVKPSQDMSSWACFPFERTAPESSCTFKAPMGM